MLRKLLAAALLALPLIGTSLAGAPANAMPMVDPAPATLARDAVTANVESVRLICGPYGCVRRHRPHWGYAPYRHRWGYNPYRHRRGYGFYGHRPWGGYYGRRHVGYGYGYHPRRHGWHRGFHHRRYHW